MNQLFGRPGVFFSLIVIFAFGQVVAQDADEYIKVEVKGKLNSHVVAIGGETTGVQITANGVTWELELGKDAKLRELAEKLNGKVVVATGELNVKSGVEIQKRWIVTVAALRPDGGMADTKNAFLDDKGHLRKALVLRDSQSGFAGESGQIWTIEPDGSWTHQSFLNAEVREADRKGKFSGSHLAALASHLRKHDLLSLPQQMGKDPGVNPHLFTITFGETSCRLIGQGGAGLPKVDPESADAPEQRVAAIVRLLQRGMKPAE